MAIAGKGKEEMKMFHVEHHDGKQILVIILDMYLQ